MDHAKQYESLMAVIRNRLDLVEAMKVADVNGFSKAETAAFHGRKVIEGIAFGCLVAVDNKLKTIPNDAKGQWSAAKILKSLDKKNLKAFPNPSVLRAAAESESSEHDVKTVIEGVPDKCLSPDELILIYDRIHKWLHEVNPYTRVDRDAFMERNEVTLWEDLEKVHHLVERHFVSIGGKGFFCTLRDSTDGLTKVVALSKP